MPEQIELEHQQTAVEDSPKPQLVDPEADFHSVRPRSPRRVSRWLADRRGARHRCGRHGFLAAFQELRDDR